MFEDEYDGYLNDPSYDGFEDEMIYTIDKENSTNKVAEKFSRIKAPRFKTWMLLDGDYQLYSEAYPKLSKRTKDYDVQSFKEKMSEYYSLFY